MKLIKLNPEHYIIVDDSEIKEGDWVIRDREQPTLVTPNFWWDFGVPYKKITHSTQPLEFENVKVFDKEWEEGYFDKIQPLNLSEVKELIDEVDVEKKAESRSKSLNGLLGQDVHSFRLGFKDGYNQALEDNKDKKYTEEDMFRMLCLGNKLEKTNFDDENFSVFFNMFKKHIQSLQPKTEWEVEFVDGKVKIKI